MELITKIKASIVEATDGNLTIEDVERVGDNIHQLGLDSLAQIKIIVLLEEEYDIEIDVEKISQEVLNSISSLCQFIEKEFEKASV